ncbi:hypothetical protein [Paenibacillus sp. Soil724D2]|uniref:hypothetical protein n=1 Tax=Paenibacillus sp. (strain Soil724D2) TaxID=1736392 RepID=UPI000715B635|nr:hypothetical protein [Paenibacillus sp. Soil724D2]KRE33451.1 hypothetical protein ASG85_14385 [Paenibacillus sp. Soil724D2]
MKLFKTNPFKIKRPLTHAEQLQSARVKGDSALTLFKTAHAQLDAANQDLSALVADAQNKVAELNKHAEAALSEISMNLAVQNRLKDFIN